ncbi:hypothetical protein EB796_024785 [Bugula neritina]|uniref:Uncharacterized protein n=1 Tax=Bugula neritina TaxID=10212 RepID=A0A7J7ITM0_BUGNE|nr:hypothetical protein EB796_024785 [Bugula neritina]
MLHGIIDLIVFLNNSLASVPSLISLSMSARSVISSEKNRNTFTGCDISSSSFSLVKLMDSLCSLDMYLINKNITQQYKY